MLNMMAQPKEVSGLAERALSSTTRPKGVSKKANKRGAPRWTDQGAEVSVAAGALGSF
jgi:hypothetical protein